MIKKIGKQIKIIFRNHHPTLVFILSMLIIFLYFDFHRVINWSPRGIHFIRQTDSLSFVDNYYLFDYSFFQPHVYNLITKDGKAACEFPLLYFIAAKIYQIFGNHYWVLRGVNLAVFTLGLFSLFQFGNRIIKDWLLALLMIVLLLTSTVIMYYAVNYLVDISALGFTLIGINLFQKSYRDNGRKILLFSFMFFLLATLTKAPFGIAPVCAICFAFIDKFLFGVKGYAGSKKLFYINLTCFISMVMGTVIWYLYAIDYNYKSGDNYFLTSITPYWNMNPEQRSVVFDAISNYWLSKYIYPQVLHTIVIALVVVFLFWRRIDRLLILFIVLGLVGAVLYLVLFYGQFKDHDYYMMPIYPSCALILMALGQLIATIPKFWIKSIIKVLLAILCVSGLHYAHGKMEERYFIAQDIYDFSWHDLNGVDKVLDKLSISSDENFMVVGDLTRNGTLFFLKHKGYTYPDAQNARTHQYYKQVKDECDYLIKRNLFKEVTLDGFEIAPLISIGEWDIYRKISER